MEVTERIKKLIAAIESGVVERNEMLRILFLAVLANQSIYIFGRSGSGKSLFAHHIIQAFAKNKVLRLGKRNHSIPEDADEYDMIYFRDFDGSGDEMKKITHILFQDFSDRPILLTGGRRPESALSEAGIIDKIGITLVLSESLRAESLQELLASSFDEESFEIKEEIRITKEEKSTWLSESKKIHLSKEVLELIGKFSEDCSEERVYVSIRKWEEFTRMIKLVAYLNGHSEATLTDTFFLGSPIWTRERNNESLVRKFIQRAEEALLRDIPTIDNFEEESARLRQRAEYLINASDDVYETIEFAGEPCIRYTVTIAGESVPLYAPERFIGTSTPFNPYNELRHKEKRVLCNFNGTSMCSISIDSVTKSVGLRASSSSAGRSFEHFARLPAKVLQIASPEKSAANKQALEDYRASLENSMNAYAQAMNRLKGIYKTLKSYTNDPFFHEAHYKRLQESIRSKFDQADQMIKLLQEVRNFMMGAASAGS